MASCGGLPTRPSAAEKAIEPLMNVPIAGSNR
jgi:hypothetical protein